jgi:hypothetical protein
MDAVNCFECGASAPKNLQKRGWTVWQMAEGEPLETFCPDCGRRKSTQLDRKYLKRRLIEKRASNIILSARVGDA